MTATERELSYIQKTIPQVINNNIEVTVLDIRGDQIKIGIAAPKEIPVYRKEVYEQIQAANKEAMTEQTPENLGKLFKN